jgi:hypothetical protein
MSRLSSETLKTMCGQVKEPLGEQIHIAWYCVIAVDHAATVAIV